MGKYYPNQTEQMLFALLRASLHGKPTEKEFFEKVAEAEWHDCYKLAATQGVRAFAWEGIRKLPAELQPPQMLKIMWALDVSNYEQTYLHYCHAVKELSDLFSKHNILTVQIKGVGLSTYYATPSHREGGDIDIFTFSADKSLMSDSEANELANQIVRDMGIEVDTGHPKHSHFDWNGIPIENHKNFLDTHIYKSAEKYDKLLYCILDPQPVELTDDKLTILIPSDSFNTLFVAYHAAQHFGAGFSLHHLCDWAALLIKGKSNIPAEVTDKRLLKMMHAMTELCNRFLGTDVKSVSVGSEADFMLKQILHPIDYDAPDVDKVKIIMFKIRRLFNNYRVRFRYLISKEQKYGNIFSFVGKSIWFYIKNPGELFSLDNRDEQQDKEI